MKQRWPHLFEDLYNYRVQWSPSELFGVNTEVFSMPYVILLFELGKTVARDASRGEAMLKSLTGQMRHIHEI